MGDFLVTSAAAHGPIVTPIVDMVLVSAIAEIKSRSMDTAVAAPVRVVVVVVILEDFQFRQVFWIGFGAVGRRRSVVLSIFLSRVLHSRRIVFVFCLKR